MYTVEDEGETNTNSLNVNDKLPNSANLPSLLTVVDHDDPSKPSHRLTNGPEPSKTIESDGRKIKNHWKTIDRNGQTAKKHSMVMVSSKTIGNLQWSLQNHWNLQLLQE